MNFKALITCPRLGCRAGIISRCAVAAVALSFLAAVGRRVEAAPPGYSLEWSDEFNEGVGQPPDPNVWNYVTGYDVTSNLELEVSDLQHSHIIADPNALDGSALQIQTTDDNGETGTNGAYEGARIISYGHVMPEYGYLEARIESPFTVGTWPAWWMLGTNYFTISWPYCGEIDIMENPGESNQSNPENLLGETNWGSLHYEIGSGYNPSNDSTNSTVPSGNLQEGYHTYAMQWGPDQLNFFLDGNLYGTHTVTESPESEADPWPYNAPEYFLLDDEVGTGGWSETPDSLGPSTWPQNFLIDYIRVYEQPYNGPHFVPGTVMNSDYDNGGEGVSYHTNTTMNASGYYRTDGVNIELGSLGPDVIGGGAGQWLKYTVDAEQAGTYTVSFNVLSTSGGSFHLEDAAGDNLTGEITVPTTSGWQFVSAPTTLPAGTQILTLVQDSGSVSFNCMAFEVSEDAPFGGIHSIPGTVQSEDYDCGGQGVGYSSANTANSGGCYRNGTVSLAVSSEGGMYVGGANPGDWLKYSVQVQNAGSYNIALRVASSAGGTLHIDDENGNPVTGEVTVPNTGGLTTWGTVNVPATLTNGTHSYTLYIDSGMFNLDFMSFAYNGSAPYNGIHVIPGIIKSVDYDNGGAGVAFSPEGAYNASGAYRADQVSIGSAYYGNPGNYDLNGLSANTWLDYSVQVQTTGAYLGTFTVSSASTGGQFHIDDENGNNLTGEITVPTTGSAITWAIVCATLNLTSGSHTLQLVPDVAGFNILDMEFSATGPIATISMSPSTIPAGSSSTGTVTLASTASNTLASDDSVVNGEYIQIASDDPAVTISGANIADFIGNTYLFIPTGQTTGTFTATASAGAAADVANMTATYYTSPRSAPLGVGVTPAPTDLKAIGGNEQVSLAWQASVGATAYNVYRGVTPNGEAATPVAAAVTSTTYTDPNLTNGTTYYYTVAALDAGGTSAPSNEASATPLQPAPAAPTNLAVEPGDGSLSLAWTQSATATSYNIYVGDSPNGEGSEPLVRNVPGTSDILLGMTNGTTYYVKVTGVNEGGEGPASNEAHTTPLAADSLPQGIAFFSSPYDYSSTNLDGLFETPGVTLYVWDPMILLYDSSPTPPANAVSLGVGYWVKLSAATQFAAAGSPADTTQPFSIPLSTGWNQIGDPFTNSVALSQTTFVKGPAILTWSQATSGAKPLVNPAVWGYSAAKGYTSTKTLQTYQGYFIYASGDLTMQISPP